MKISLRKSNALQLAIADMINDISTNSRVEISPFEDAMQVIEAKRSELVANLAKIEMLRGILYDIRKKTAYANSTSGINDVLSDIAHIEKNIRTYTMLSSDSSMLMPDETVILGKLEKLKNRTEEVYGPDSITVSVIPKTILEGYKQKVLSLKKDKQKLQDILLELNVKHEIILTDDSVETLKSEGLL